MRYISYNSDFDDKIRGIELKPYDKIELICTTGSKERLSEALVEGCNRSLKSFVIVDKKKDVHGVFGLNTIDHIGIPWLLCDEKVNTHKIQLVKESKAVIDYFLSKVEVMTNLVHKDNADSIKFLKCLGFNFCDKFVRMKRESFMQFYKYREGLEEKERIFER